MSWFDDNTVAEEPLVDRQRAYYPATFDPNFNYADAYTQFANDNVRATGGTPVMGDPAPQAGGPNTGGGANPLSFDDLMGKLRQAYPSGTNADFAQAQRDHPDWFKGWTVTGSKGDKLTKDGRTYDMIIASGEGGKGWNGTDVTDGGGDAGVSHTFSYPEFTDTFSYPDFQAPTGLTEQNDPGFEQRLKLGTDALQRSAAAKGSLLTGGTLKDLNQFAQDYASNEFQNVYNRDAQTYLTNRNNAASNFYQRYQQYENGFQNALAAFGANNTVDQNLWNRAFTANQAGFANMMSLADLGLAGTGGFSNVAGNYGLNAGNLITGIGNTNAAGQVGGANAWNGSLSQLSNLGLGYLYNSMYPSNNNSIENMGWK